jgi:hypothetical protein
MMNGMALAMESCQPVVIRRSLETGLKGTAARDDVMAEKGTAMAWPGLTIWKHRHHCPRPWNTLFRFEANPLPNLNATEEHDRHIGEKEYRRFLRGYIKMERFNQVQSHPAIDNHTWYPPFKLFSRMSVAE